MLEQPQILQHLLTWRTRLSAAAWVIVRDAHAAEDLFQNMVLKCMSHQELRFDSPESLLSWATVTIRHESLDWLKHSSRKGAATDMLEGQVLELLDRESRLRTNTGRDRRLEMLERCLEALTPESRRLLDLRYFEGLDCTSVGTTLGLGVQVIYKRLSRLHEMLRECVERRLQSEVVSEGGRS